MFQCTATQRQSPKSTKFKHMPWRREIDSMLRITSHSFALKFSTLNPKEIQHQTHSMSVVIATFYQKQRCNA